jgi:hypothetical protein
LLAGSSQVITSNDTVPWGEVLRWSHDSRTYQKKWCEPLPAPITRGSRVQASGLCVGATLCRGGRWSLLPMATETSIRTKNNLTFQHKTTTIQHATATATPLESYVALIVLTPHGECDFGRCVFGRRTCEFWEMKVFTTHPPTPQKRRVGVGQRCVRLSWSRPRTPPQKGGDTINYLGGREDQSI